MSSITSCAARPSIVHPTLCAVPKTSLHVPESSRAIERGLITRAMLITSSNEIIAAIDLLFFTFFLSLGGSLSALTINEAADGTTEIAA
ncbi:unnamed protein product [Chironomus riparius]|uniref:Uncharacterized protein n=1 Tax=Chironomus riparius TaxID=315576 RepID=A0A9N9RWJ1_9DIPT|nr:unnamed protein product [Chironomus riparius]